MRQVQKDKKVNAKQNAQKNIERNCCDRKFVKKPNNLADKKCVKQKQKWPCKMMPKFQNMQKQAKKRQKNEKFAVFFVFFDNFVEILQFLQSLK